MLRVSLVLLWANLTHVQAGLRGWGVGASDQLSPPQQLVRFLQEFELSGHAGTMAALGYDSVSDFMHMTEDELLTMTAALEQAGIPPGHIGRVRRAITTLRSRSNPDRREAAQSSPDGQLQHSSQRASNAARRLSTSTSGKSTLLLQPDAQVLGEIVHGANLTAAADGHVVLSATGSMTLESANTLSVRAAAGMGVSGEVSAASFSASGGASIRGNLSAASVSTVGDASVGGVLRAPTVMFGDGTSQSSAPAFTGRPLLPLTHNLVNNGMFNRRTGTVPDGYSVQKYSCAACTATIEAVHAYTQCFEGPYLNEPPGAAASTCEDATAATPYFFGRYNMGPRIGRGGMGGGGWGGRGDGHVLKITGTYVSGAGNNNIFVDLPIEGRHVSRNMLFRCYLKIIKGGATFGTDQSMYVSYTCAYSAAASSTQGWLHIHEKKGSSHISNQNYHHAWNLKLYGEEANLGGDFEMYLALPYLANVWMPDADGTDTEYTAHWTSSVKDVLLDYGWQDPGRRLSAGEPTVGVAEPSRKADSTRGIALLNTMLGEQRQALEEQRRMLEEQQAIIAQMHERLGRLDGLNSEGALRDREAGTV